MIDTFRESIVKEWLVVYMDDILIFSEMLEEQQEQTKHVLFILQSADLFLKPSKCSFDQGSIEYLSLIIWHGQISMDPVKMNSICQWTTPQFIKDMCSFLGFCNFYW